MVQEADSAEAVVTNQGYIEAVGRESELRSRYGDHVSEEIHINGVLYPGFVDSHLHVVGHGEKLLQLDVSGVKSLDELKVLLQQKANETPPGSWITAEGFNENLYEGSRVPDKYFLDQITTSHPVMVTRVCRHAMTVNSYALEAAGVDASTVSPEGGRIERSEEGEPTGYIHDQAQELIRGILPEKSRDDVKLAMQTALTDLHRNGFTGGHTEDLFYYRSPKETLELFYELIHDEQRFRADLLVHHEALDEVLAYEAEHPYVKLNTVKIFADGALGGRTALLSSPYDDAPGVQGVAIHSQEEMDALVKRARKAGMGAAVHVIGDAALEMALHAVETYPAPPGTRDRFIHLQVTRPDLRKRMQRLPLVLDIQPQFTASDFPWVIERLGRARMKDAFAWKTLLREGLLCAGGSDAPIEPVNPLLGLHAAVTRRKPEERHQGWYPEEALTPFEAVQLFTHGSAQAVVKEERAGIIAPGYEADFTVLSGDLFTLDPDRWLELHVEQTVVAGAVMYSRREN